MLRHKNKITLYMVSEPYDLKNTSIPKDKHIYTFVDNVNYAYEYIARAIYNAHYNHYSSWCKIRNIEVCNANWALYCQSLGGFEEEFNSYQITKLKFDTQSIALLFRNEYGCAPLGCSYECSQEKALYDDTINDTTNLDKLVS